MTLVTPTPTAIDIFPDSIQSALREIERAMNMNVMVRMRDKESSNMGVMMHLFANRFRAFGFTNRANGAYRVAFIHGTEPWVIKMARRHIPSDTGYTDNLREAFVYANIEQEHRVYLPETFLWKDAVLVQRKYPPDANRHSLRFKDIEKVAGVIGVGDLHNGNIGFDENGKFRFIDFQPSLGHHWDRDKPIGRLFHEYEQIRP